jgi:hypothetical protein
MRRRVYVLNTYYDEAGGEHIRRLPGVRLGKAGFGRVKVIYRQADGEVVCRKLRPAVLRARTL